ncbi:MAG: hypothetical protein GZ087_09035 [Flavobacterium sp.]|uniref:Uncharacterized protein n=1 Tax=Flavobacterium frigoris TaxID=229204 RepID=A0A1H9RUW0_FLAFI|nr:hypothetical protein [Flavobacterium frigoris]NDP27552.1 hypothetical protein [Flavobacterium sp.]SER75913.1 hypothetical protein SAMN05444355_1248 [Flavobacterium frigoris]
MEKKYFLKFIIAISLLVTVNSYSYITNPKDSIKVNQKKETDFIINDVRTKNLKTVEIKVNTSLNFDNEISATNLKAKYRLAAETDKNAKEALSVFKKIDSIQNFISNLSPKSLSSLPLGIKKTIGNIEYTLGISNAKFTPDHTELTAFVRIKIPQVDSEGAYKELFFGANNIKLSHKGGLYGDTNLVLLGDFPMKLFGDKALLVLKGGMTMETGDIKNKTYVTIDCNGFKELGITADIEFSRETLEPLDSNNKVIVGPSRVTGNFTTVVSNWNDILAEFSLPKFQVTSCKGTAFELQTAVIDLSDLRNSPNVVWPQNYQNDYLVPGNENLWKGVYIKTVSVTLPEQFKRKGSPNRIVIQGTDLLFDSMGFSGKIAAANVFPITEGDASGWQFSLDRIEMAFKANALIYGRFSGAIVLPISKEVTEDLPLVNVQAEKTPFDYSKSAVATSTTNTTTTPAEDEKAKKPAKPANAALDYTAIIDPIKDEYTLNIVLRDNISFDLFKGKARLEKNSYIELKVNEGKFRPKAMLTGSLDINGSNSLEETKEDKGTVAFKGITFQNLQLQTVVPYIKADYLGYTGPVKVSNFPVTISDIAFRATDTEASLEFRMAINLMENQFNGETKLKINGGFSATSGIQKWKFRSLQFEEIKLAADLGGVKFKGSITIMDNDSVYGNGFKGSLGADFTGGISVEANAIFGSTSFRYWYVDAMVDNLNIPAGAITFKGFGGGAFYRMKKDGFSSRFAASGSNYVPDDASGLGVKAIIKFAGTASSDTFWGGAGFEIAFNKNGGINRTSIYGEGHVMQPFEVPGAEKLKGALKTLSENESLLSQVALEALKTSNLSKAAEQLYPNNVKSEMGINAFAAIEYDFRSKTLHGSFDLYIDTPGGFIKGRASGNRAGWAVLHFAPNTWYIRMGTPTDRLGLKMAIGPVEVEAGGYFMIGDDIPASPPPPAIIASILKIDNATLDYMRNENSNAIGSGKGFAFGSDFSIKTGDLSFLIFYANFQAGFGFDIMMKDYGEAACKGSGPIGINGWYANGQSYAYLQGELGINIKLFFVRKKIPIIKAGAAVLLQAKLPNPVWIRGYLGGQYSLLGGMVKGSFRFKVELGKQCEFVSSSPLAGLNAIGDLKPEEGASVVDVFTIPQVSFNMPIEKNFEIEDDKGKKTYRLKLEEFSVKKEGTLVIGTITWNDTKDLLSFNSVEVLPQNSELELSVKVSFQENINGNWKTILDNGQIATEAKSLKFKTGSAPQYIPLSNVAYCYPIFEQKYLYQNESKQAFVILKQGQPYLFELKPGESQKVIYKNKETSQTGNLVYDSANRKVNFDIPTLTTKSSYSVSLQTILPRTNGGNTLSESTKKEDFGDNTTLEVKNKDINNTTISATDIELLQYNFQTSQFNTFQEKMNAKKSTQTLVDPIYTDVHALQSANDASEPFDQVELIGNAQTLNTPLIDVEAILDDAYFLNEIYPLVYKGYPLNPNLTLDRATNYIGVAPTKAIHVMSWYETYLANEPNSFLLKERLPYRYNLVSYYKDDFNVLRYKVANYFSNSLDPKYNALLTEQFPYLKKGNYKMKLTYTIPGGQTGTTSIFTYNKTN